MQDNFNHLSEKGWSHMAKILDKEMPEKPSRKAYLLWWFLLPLMLLGTAYFMNGNAEKAVVQSESNSELLDIRDDNSTVNEPEKPITEASVNTLEQNDDGPSNYQTLTRTQGPLNQPEKPANNKTTQVRNITSKEIDQNTQTSNNEITDLIEKNNESEMVRSKDPYLFSDESIRWDNVPLEVNQEQVTGIEKRPISNTLLQFSRSLPSPKIVPLSIDKNGFFGQAFAAYESEIPFNLRGYSLGVGLGKTLGQSSSVYAQFGFTRLQYSSSSKSELVRFFEASLGGDINEETFTADIYNDLDETDIIDKAMYLDFKLGFQQTLIKRFGVLANVHLRRLISVDNVFPADVNTLNATPLAHSGYQQFGNKYLEEAHILNNTLYNLELGIFYRISNHFDIQASYALLTSDYIRSSDSNALIQSVGNGYKYRPVSLQVNYRFLNH